MSKLKEERISGAVVYSGKFFKVYKDAVRLPDGSESEREYVRHSGAVLIVPLLPNGRVLLERQFRYPLAREFIEVPAGKREAGENPLDTAQRELLEETGYRAAHWEWLAGVHPVISYSTERIEMFLATGLTEDRAQLDAGEFLETLALDFADAYARMKAGEITDVKTIVGLYQLRDRGWS